MSGEQERECLEFLRAQQHVWEARYMAMNYGKLDGPKKIEVNMVRGFAQALKRRVAQWEQYLAVAEAQAEAEAEA